MVKIVEDIFGIAPDPLTDEPKVIRRYTITNTNRMSVGIITLGAIIQNLSVPDAFDHSADVILGFDDIAGYLKYQNYKFGCIMGRVAGLISNGTFILDEHRVIASKNLDKKHHGEGGFIGFHKFIWELHSLRRDGITLRHVSEAGHEGLPGRLVVFIAFTVDDDSRLFIRIEATTDKSTPVDICHHTYFNMAGHMTGVDGLFDHRISIDSKDIVEMDADDSRVPTGLYNSVEDSVYDVRIPVFLGDRVRQFKDQTVPGYHVTYAMGKTGPYQKTQFVARFLHHGSGRFMDIYSNQPALHFSTTNNFPEQAHSGDAILGKKCTRYWQHSGFVAQLMALPDSCNQEPFPNIFLLPGDIYVNDTILHFRVREPWHCCVTQEEFDGVDKDLVMNSLVLQDPLLKV